MPDFKCTVGPTPPAPGCVEIILAGTVATPTITPFQETIDRQIKPGIHVIILQMKDVNHMSSAPLAYLVAIADRLERQGGLVIMVQAQQKILQIMDTLGLRTLFKSFATAEEGRAHAKAHAEKLSKSPRLVQVLGGNPGAEYPILTTRLTLGSDPKNSIVLSHHQVEPRHAEVYKTGEQVMVKDLGTRFGTFVDGKRVTEAPLPMGKIGRAHV